MLEIAAGLFQADQARISSPGKSTHLVLGQIGEERHSQKEDTKRLGQFHNKFETPPSQSWRYQPHKPLNLESGQISNLVAGGQPVPGDLLGLTQSTFAGLGLVAGQLLVFGKNPVQTGCVFQVSKKTCLRNQTQASYSVWFGETMRPFSCSSVFWVIEELGTHMSGPRNLNS